MKPDESRRVYDGKLIDVTVEQWGDNVREIVEHPSAVAIVPIDADGKIVLVRQLREAVRGELLELPAGKRDEGEDPLTTGKRELREECGLTGGEWTLLTEFWTTPGFCRERMHVFLAEGVEEGEAEPDEDEVVEIERWSVEEVESRIGEIEDAKTLVGLLLYLRRVTSTS
jgi:ADP-ribose pyrophosphatase